MKRSLPKAFKKVDLCKKYNDLVFFLEEENGINLYRIEFDAITGKYIPFPMSQLPSLHYNHSGKQNHMISFLENKHIHHVLDGNDNIIIFDPQIEEYKIATAPLYIYNNVKDVYCKKEIHTAKLPTKNMGEAAYLLYEKWYKKIQAEGVLFDFMQLTMDGGKSAYFEYYSIAKLKYLKKNKFLIFELEYNPNHTGKPYNEYTNYCRVDPGKYFSRNGSFFVVFNKEAIANEAIEKYSINGEVSVILPSDVVSGVVGKAGENIRNIVYSLGISRLIVNPSLLKNTI